MQYAPRNYSRGDVAVAEMTVSLLAAFAKTGDPTPRADERHHEGVTSWPRYEMNTQQYLSIGKRKIEKEREFNTRTTRKNYKTVLM